MGESNMSLHAAMKVSPSFPPSSLFSGIGTNLHGPTSVIFERREIQIPYLQMAVLVLMDTPWRMGGRFG